MLSGKKFAIIEDNTNFANLVDWTLADCLVNRYREVSHFSDKDYDLVFLDLRLHETWGVESITALRAKTQLPIIVLTGLGGPYLGATDMKAFLDAGATEVFGKEIVNDPAFPGLIKSILDKK